MTATPRSLCVEGGRPSLFYSAPRRLRAGPQPMPMRCFHGQLAIMREMQETRARSRARLTT
jgi:hypothetical protein